jgi:5'-deoxynucleotidase YfbR-like HD superfamily hydrolase
LEFIENGGVTKRCHTMNVLKEQSVAAHSYGVAWLVWLLCEEQPSLNLVMAALAHDTAEHQTGDIPNPAKLFMGISKMSQEWEETLMGEAFLPIFTLSAEEQRILRLADCMELAMYCGRERRLGNDSKRLKEMFHNVTSYVEQILQKEHEEEVWTAICSNMNWRGQ